MVAVDALPVPVRGRGLAVDGEPEGFVLDNDGVGRRRRASSRRSDGQPVRVGEPERAVVAALHVEPALVHQPVMGRAEQDEVVERGLPALGPVPDVVAMEPVDGGTAGEAPPAVAARERPAHRGRDAAGAPPDAQRLAAWSVDDGDDAGVAAEPPGSLRRDGGAVLDFTAPGAAVREDFRLAMDDWLTTTRNLGQKSNCR